VSRILVSLGGNSLGTEFDELVVSVGVVAAPLAGLLRDGHEVVVCHGNGPQVGMIKTSIDQGKAGIEMPTTPLSECVAMSQAYVGYHLQNAIQNQLHAARVEKSVVTVITRVLVDPDDPRFRRPTKPIGAFFTAEQAEHLREQGKPMIEDSGRGYREVVASPLPQAILEKSAVLDLVRTGHVVIAWRRRDSDRLPRQLVQGDRRRHRQGPRVGNARRRCRVRRPGHPHRSGEGRRRLQHPWSA
jgi:carbamate kinase